jgi:formylglycine-generating enzyme required for sulfatase activity
MIGNLWEYVLDWYAGPGDMNANQAVQDAWFTPYGDDAIFNIGGGAWDRGPGERRPAAALRGGAWVTGFSAGPFAFDVSSAPSNVERLVGARCCAGGP